MGHFYPVKNDQRRRGVARDAVAAAPARHRPRAPLLRPGARLPGRGVSAGAASGPAGGAV